MGVPRSRFPSPSRTTTMAEAPTLLVADDDPAVRESLERTLKREGYRVVVASDGPVEEAGQAMKDGASAFRPKPFQRAQLIRLIRKALERRALIAENRALQQRLGDPLRPGAGLGPTP